MTVALMVKRGFPWLSTDNEQLKFRHGRQWRPIRMIWIQAQGHSTQINDLGSSNISNHGTSDKLMYKLTSCQLSKMTKVCSQLRISQTSFDETYKGRFQKMACGVEKLSGLKFLRFGS